MLILEVAQVALEAASDQLRERGLEDAAARVWADRAQLSREIADGFENPECSKYYAEVAALMQVSNG